MVMNAPRRPARSPLSTSFIEQLEARQLLAASLSGGVLTVDGGNGADLIRVSVAGPNIVVKLNRASAKTFARTSVQQLVVNGKNGNDRINVTGGIPNIVLNGGAGDDTIRGSGAADLISGGDGDDELRGRKGNDQVYGDAGDDVVFGGDGNDTLGGDDEDMLAATNINSTLEGNDTLNGGNGNDWLLGGTESDLHDDLSGNDSYAGNAGADILDIRGRNEDGLETGDGDTITQTDPTDRIPVRDLAGVDQGEDDLTHHKHAFIKIFLEDKDGNQTLMHIPSNAGEFFEQPTIHTHENPSPLDARGFLMHFHNTDDSGGAARVLTLGDFFEHWGISLSDKNIGRFRVDQKHTLTMQVQVRGTGGFITPAQNFNNYAIATNDTDVADSTKYDQIRIIYKTTV
jgi:hypothetical protein